MIVEFPDRIVSIIHSWISPGASEVVMVPGRPLSPKVETTFDPSTRIVATSSSASWICAITVCGRPGASRMIAPRHHT